jgi:hypothetical protein
MAERAVLKELDYGINIAVQGLITAMGMQAENKQREHRGESLAYTEADFQKVLLDNGIHHNAVLKRWEGV